MEDHVPVPGAAVVSGLEDRARRPDRTRLSKTSIAAFEQCAKKLWLKIHRPEAGRFDATSLQLFASGHIVGDLGRKEYPSGILVDEDHHQLLAAISRTRLLMQRVTREPIFEAAFHHASVVVRADILLPGRDGAWRLVEVKNSGQVRPAAVSDLTTQAWVLAGSGVRLAGAFVRHPVEPLRPWQRRHAIRFVDVDLSEAVRLAMTRKAAIVQEAAVVAAGPMPATPVGPHCSMPYRCEFRDYCRAQLQDGNFRE